MPYGSIKTDNIINDEGNLNITTIPNVDSTINTINVNIGTAQSRIVRDGSTSLRAAVDAKSIQETFGITTDGVYWINLPVVGPTQVYCIMDPNCAGGGWMLAMKGAANAATFQYTSTHWTTYSLLNSTDNNRNANDAKFNTFNYFPSKDLLAIFPDQYTGGDIPFNTTYNDRGYGGWTWVENDFSERRTSLTDFFVKNSTTIKSSIGYVFPYCGIEPKSDPKHTNRIWVSGVGWAYGNSPWTSQTGYQVYGFNLVTSDRPYFQNGIRQAYNWGVRWGFMFNNEGDANTCDCMCGIGVGPSNATGTFGTFNGGQNGVFSAGDATSLPSNPLYDRIGINRSARVEIYVR